MGIVVYEYKCPNCKYVMETSLRSEGHVCPNCDDKIMQRVYHAPTIHFKGGGFSKEMRG